MKGRPPPGRLVALFVVLALSFGGVAARLLVLQVRDADAYRALARDQRIRNISLPAARGRILDRDGHELALSLPAKAVYADPFLVRDPDATAKALGPLLDVHRDLLRERLGAGGRFVYLARRVAPAVAREIEALGLPGIGFLEESERYYPGGDLAAQLLGFVGIDEVGLAGLELQYDDVLAGRPGRMVIEQDPAGNQIPHGETSYEAPIPGDDLVLTIDRDLQFQAERALQAAIQANGAQGGTVIMLDPTSGEVLALATRPGFDANAFDEVDPALTQARAVTDVYEPGSVNKVITAAAALEEGVIGVDDILHVPDHLLVADHVFHDAHTHAIEPMTLTDIVSESSNVGTIRVAKLLGADLLDHYLRRFGFGTPTGVGFPGEQNGILMRPEDWWGTSIGTIPIGQGIAVTPLQMASVYATIANGGVRVQPTLVRGTIDPAGRFHEAPKPDRRRVVSARTAGRVTGMLTQAVMAGTGIEAQVSGYWVAGKTGTARKPLGDGLLGYSDKYVASFIGFLPAGAPRLVVAAVLDEPTTVYGGIASAPLFREVARFGVAHLRIPPADRPAIPPLAGDG
jgi:cell division protein FtsI (penicillin-binding protein 3)